MTYPLMGIIMVNNEKDSCRLVPAECLLFRFWTNLFLVKIQYKIWCSANQNRTCYLLVEKSSCLRVRHTVYLGWDTIPLPGTTHPHICTHLPIEAILNSQSTYQYVFEGGRKPEDLEGEHVKIPCRQWPKQKPWMPWFCYSLCFIAVIFSSDCLQSHFVFNFATITGSTATNLLMTSQITCN